MPYVCGDVDSREFSGGMAILAVTDGGLEWSTQFADISTPVCLPSKGSYTCNIPAGCSAYLRPLFWSWCVKQIRWGRCPHSWHFRSIDKFSTDASFNCSWFWYSYISALLLGSILISALSCVLSMFALLPVFHYLYVFFMIYYSYASPMLCTCHF